MLLFWLCTYCVDLAIDNLYTRIVTRYIIEKLMNTYHNLGFRAFRLYAFYTVPVRIPIILSPEIRRYYYNHYFMSTRIYFVRWNRKLRE